MLQEKKRSAMNPESAVIAKEEWGHLLRGPMTISRVERCSNDVPIGERHSAAEEEVRPVVRRCEDS
jgi:hypothetical protein